MPNWCFVELQVHGPKLERKKLMQSLESMPEKRFSDMFPMPVRDDGSIDPEHFYDWWGTKWGDVDTELQNAYTGFDVFTFKSAWSIPTRLFEMLSGRYPKMLFSLSFTEESNAFAGWKLIKNKAIVSEGWVTTDDPPTVDWDTFEGQREFDSWETNILHEVHEECDLDIRRVLQTK